MPNSKTLFDAVEVELRNARAALNNVGGYIDMLKEIGMEGRITLNCEDGSLVYTPPRKTINTKLEEHSKLL